MTYQYLTVTMFEKSKENNGFVDQTEFKTAQQYTFDSLIFDETSTRILDDYVLYVRHLLNPQCDYILVTRSGTQFTQFSSLMSELVFQAIGKYVHPTRYRQTVETESARKLSSEEQEIVSQDQKHSSQVARTYYQKRTSREIATTAKSAMRKLQNKDVDRELKRLVCNSDESSEPEDGIQHVEKSFEITMDTAATKGMKKGEMHQETEKEVDTESITSFQPPVRQASKLKAKSIVNGRVPFTSEEDDFLRKGLRLYGFGKWTAMLRDPRFQFNKKRTPDSLKKRAELLARK